LRLRERFNPTRLKREVEIMSRLHHPNIIQFIEVFEDPDHLMMVMEYCPGKELFDVILARKFFKEDDAKPIFAQVARALYYLHSLNIIHRDIKPENILISDKPDLATGGLVAKLLDFGLSKNAGAGSEAKTFVGTPCYLAPEVEYTSKGLGGTYGLAADCWSLGAVLYVMLVARFPEFEQDFAGKVVVKLAPSLWNNVSSEAKDLIRSLMNTNPNARLTMYGVLQHPWLGAYRATQQELTSISVANSELNNQLQDEVEELEQEEEQEEEMRIAQGGSDHPEITAGGNVVRHQAMILRQNDLGGHHAHNNPNPQVGPENLKLAPLLHLQRSIALCFEEAHAEYQEFPEVASQIRRGAVLCRHQLVESTKMLRKVEQTAKEVLEMFPDLELAIEEDEPKLASEFFNIVKEWVVELREQVNSTQKINKASMNQIQRVVEQSTMSLKEKVQEKERHHTTQMMLAKQFVETILQKLNPTTVGNALTNGSSKGGAASNNAGNNNGHDSVDLSNVNIDANSAFELFLSLFSAATQQQQAAIEESRTPSPPPSYSLPAGKQPPQPQQQSNGQPVVLSATPPPQEMDVDDTSPSKSLKISVPVPPRPPLASSPPGRSPVFNKSRSGGNNKQRINGGDYQCNDIDEECFTPQAQPGHRSDSRNEQLMIETSDVDEDEEEEEENEERQQQQGTNNRQVVPQQNGAVAQRSPRTATRLSEALHKLRQVKSKSSPLPFPISNPLLRST